MVDGATRIKPVDGRNCPFIFNISEAAQGNRELIVAPPRGDAGAGFLHVPEAKSQSLPNLLEFLAAFRHDRVSRRRAGLPRRKYHILPKDTGVSVRIIP